ncbi:gamma-glutamyltransferase, partial [Lactobacillus gasseri]
PLAAQAGLRILQQGGNAVDAAIATAACLTVVEPTTNGIGSDAFAIISINGQQYGINGSGPAPQNLKVADLQAAGLTEMPK